MKFTKMHGLGNDYVYVNLFEQRVDDPVRLAPILSDRRTGVGSDGLILIGPSDDADVRMEMYNADGSRAEMCGNGIRCVAKYAIEHGIAEGPSIAIDTDDGIKRAQCLTDGRSITSVRIDMGIPAFDPESLPSTIQAERIMDFPLDVGGESYVVTCVSMGNPHAVVFVEKLDEIDLHDVGPLFERAPEFPRRINAHFVRVVSRQHMIMKTWERGSGVTMACGTGACAVAVAGAVTDRTDRRVSVDLPGGRLEIDWSDDEHVYMTGPAVEVFTGEWAG